MRVSRWTVLFLGVSIPAIGFPLRAQTDAQQLAREVAANELRARLQAFSPWMYTLRKDDAGGKEVLQVVNTKDGPLAQAAEMLQAPQSSALLSPPTPQRRSAASLER
jgi:hypothetical protein